ncbi:hypothetical protein JQX13_50175 [Archangium violaceum]|uniref:hypothetical protein n=1 Tax=Archangium violaceum TaxID=83451 RepID=UPI00193C6F7A|nr:hypothetical protein [Archangium violaceum]QRK08041.1 hypothetical protein JQX13_50175 [Archangium violaceum]
MRLLDASRFTVLDTSVLLGPTQVHEVGLASAPVMAALLWGALVRQSSERWLSYGLAVGFALVPAFLLPMFFPDHMDRAFGVGALLGLIGIPLGLVFSRDRSGAMSLHLSIAMVVLGSAVLYVLALPFQAETLEFFFNDLLGEATLYGLGFFALLCLGGGQQLASRFVQYEPVYKALVVGMTGGALLTILLRSFTRGAN